MLSSNILLYIIYLGCDRPKVAETWKADGDGEITCSIETLPQKAF